MKWRAFASRLDLGRRLYIQKKMTAGMDKVSASIVCLGMVWLSIPCIVFLLGWCTAPVACVAGILIVVYLVRNMRAVFKETAREGGPVLHPENPHSPWHILLAAVSVLLLLYCFLWNGMVGLWNTSFDTQYLRQALLSNLRDAPWPVVFPDGRTLTYYIADLLPVALAARVWPSSALVQWVTVFYFFIPVVISIALLSTRISNAGNKLLSFSFLAIGGILLVDPVQTVFISSVSCDYWHCALRHCGITYSTHMLPLYGKPIEAISLSYNSVVPSLLALAIMLVCSKSTRGVVPFVMILTGMISPLGAVGILPFALYCYIRKWKSEKWALKSVLKESPLPVVLAVVAACYYMQGQSDVALSTPFRMWGWRDWLFVWGCSLVSLGVLVLPLWKKYCKDSIFLLLVSCLAVVPWIYIGSSRSYEMEVGSGNMTSLLNELFLKNRAVYMLLLSGYWVGALQDKECKWLKAACAGCCIAVFSVAFFKSFVSCGTSPYMEVKDVWNGHLYHDADFLKQSVPPTKEPPIPGILLREGGSSECGFPGFLLPKAPGCDYSRTYRFH